MTQHTSGYKVSKFISIVLRPGKKVKSDVLPEVYMVSDQAQILVKEGLLEQPESRKFLKIREPKNEVDIIPAVLHEGKQIN